MNIKQLVLASITLLCVATSFALPNMADVISWSASTVIDWVQRYILSVS